MAEVHYQLGAAIPLNQMIPEVDGEAEVPQEIPNAPGLYLILNQANLAVRNRYMGISSHLRDRFRQRQAACFELGFARNILDPVAAYVGQVRYRSHGVAGWSDAAGYREGELSIDLDGYSYDFEHLFIKSAQSIFGGTITNTKKVRDLTNNHPQHAIDISITWLEGQATLVRTLSLGPGQTLPE